MKFKDCFQKLQNFLRGKSDICMVNASEINDSQNNRNAFIESSIPKACLLGNLNFDKEYDKAIEEGKLIEAEYPNDYFVHCNLMVSYFKKGDIENCNKEAKLAIIKGHHTGYCESRLSINLYKDRKYHQVIQLSEIEENPRFGLFFDDVYKRKLKAQKHIDKATDTKEERLFTEEEIEELYQNVEKQKALREWYMRTRSLINEELCKLRKKDWLNDKSVVEEMEFYTNELIDLSRKYGHLC